MIRRSPKQGFPRTHRLRRALMRSSVKTSHQFLDSIIEHLPNMIFVKEAEELRFIRFNKAGEELLGFSRTALIGKNDFDFFPREQAEWFTQKDREVLEGGCLVDIPEETIQTAKLGPRILHTKKIPLLDKANRAKYLLGISEDITGQKQTQAALSAQMARFQSLVRINQLISSCLDMNRVLGEIAASAAKLSGVAVVSLWVADERGKELFVRGFSDDSLGRALFADDAVRWGEGAVGWVAAHKSPLHVRELAEESGFPEHLHWKTQGVRSFLGVPIVDDQRVLAVLALASKEPIVFGPDERCLLESFAAQTAVAIRNASAYAAAFAARDAALDASRAKSQFLAVMSHELRTPLTAIMGYSALVREELDEGKLESVHLDLAKIEAAGRHLLTLINDVLDLSKIEAGKMDLDLQKADAAALLDEAVNVIRDAARRNGNELMVKCAPGLRAMQTDSTKVRQCLVNLLGNACKFTEGGQVCIEALASEMEGEAGIEFRVSDTGIGMSPEQLERAFEVFSQADTTTTRKYGGTGLGLSLTRRYCELLGGTISVKSKLGEGTSFTMWLPLVAKETLKRRRPSWPRLGALRTSNEV